MKRKEFGERWSFIWYAIATLIIVGSAFLISDTLQEKAVEVIVVTVETFEEHEVKAKVTKAEKHVEELETGLLIDEESLEILARIIHGESGSNWCSDKMQLYVGSVFLNRVASEHFPNTFKEVAFQENQYSCTRQGSGYWQEPTERDYANARFLIKNGSQLDKDYLWQSNFKQGTDVIQEQNMYFGKKK